MLKVARSVHSKLTTMDFRSADSGLLRDLLGRASQKKTLEGKVVHENWLIFKDHFLQTQE